MCAGAQMPSRATYLGADGVRNVTMQVNVHMYLKHSYI
jgi:hypothetical protein